MASLSSPKFTDDVKDELRAVFRKRWDEFSSPLHCAGFALDPEFQEHRFNPEVMRGLRHTCKLMLGDTESAKAAMLGHAAYRAKEGDFGDPIVVGMAEDMPSYQWWESCGDEYPELKKVAVRVLAMISGAGACERNWSAYDFVHSKKRNRLDLRGLKIWCMSSPTCACTRRPRNQKHLQNGTGVKRRRKKTGRLSRLGRH